MLSKGWWVRDRCRFQQGQAHVKIPRDCLPEGGVGGQGRAGAQIRKGDRRRVTHAALG